MIEMEMQHLNNFTKWRYWVETSTDSEGRWEFELPDVGPGEKIKIISSDKLGHL